jgi:hypothetical protein
MENILPQYERPFKTFGDLSHKWIEHYWYDAMEAYDKKEYKRALLLLLEYIDNKILDGIDTDKPFTITQMQGTAEIRLEIDDERLRIEIPFVQITPQTNETALLRKVAELNFSKLDLIQMVLEEDQLILRYEMPLELCQPYKVYDILYNGAFVADRYDDIFIDKFQAAFIHEPKLMLLSDEEHERALRQVHAILQEHTDYVTYFKEKQWNSYLWDIIAITLLKLGTMPYVNGKLKSDIEDALGELFDGNVHFDTRVDRGTNFIKKLLKKTPEEIGKNLYMSEYLIYPLWRSSKEIIKEAMEAHAQTVQKYENDNRHFALAYFLKGVFLKLIYNYNLEENYAAAIYTVLEECAGKEPKEAAPKLLKLYKEMSEGRLNEAISEYIEPEKNLTDKIWSTVQFIAVVYLIYWFLVR